MKNAHPAPSVLSHCKSVEDREALHIEEAKRRLREIATPVQGYEQVELCNAAFRVLHHAITAPFHVPLYTNSAVDGYAVRIQDILPYDKYHERKLYVKGSAFAGKPFLDEVEPGHAIRIMTGAPLPKGTDTVLMQEEVRVEDSSIWVNGPYSCGENVRQAGEDILQGSTVLEAGRCLIPPDIGLIASMGLPYVLVKRRVQVALISTGSEICCVGELADVEGSVYDSNRHMLRVMLQRENVEISDKGVIPDDRKQVRSVIEEASFRADVILTTGGVSVGEADYVREVLMELGELSFWKVAMKPGRPMGVGKIGHTVLLALPGNPVAALICFLQFVRPVLQQMMGRTEPTAPVNTLEATSLDYLNKKPGRTEFQRGILERTPSGEWQVRKTGGQGSAILTSMSLANALIVLPHERGAVKQGELVEVQPLFWI